MDRERSEWKVQFEKVARSVSDDTLKFGALLLWPGFSFNANVIRSVCGEKSLIVLGRFRRTSFSWPKIRDTVVTYNHPTFQPTFHLELLRRFDILLLNVNCIFPKYNSISWLKLTSSMKRECTCYDEWNKWICYHWMKCIKLSRST